MMKKILIIFGLTILLTGCATAKTNKYYDEALASVEANDYDAAVSTLQKSIDEDVRLPESYRLLGISYLKMGDNASAIAALSRSLNSLETTDEAFKKDVMYYLAEARAKHGQIKEAIEVYTEILKSGKDERSLYLRGELELKSGDVEAAKSDFDKATEDTKDYETFINIFSVYDNQKMSLEGEEYLNKALEIEPENADDYYQLGRIYYYMKDYSNAKRELTRAIKEGNSDGVLLLGKVYIEMEDVNSARAMYQEHLSSGDDKAKAYNGLALCDIYEKKYDDALLNIDKGLAEEESEERQDLLFNEIVAYEYKLDFETAKEKISAYLKIYPDDAAAIRENEFLQSR